MFRFKQFTVHDDQCAMKVGTDGVLLGAWTATANGEWLTANGAILDIGTGSGLIALMLAQRFPNAHILGIDIDAYAVSQANQNFAISPWNTRLHAEHIALQDLASNSKFQLIVSNPPFFQNSLKAPNAARSTARHTDTLSYADLIAHSAALLAPNGILSLILPFEAEEEIIQLAYTHNLFPTRICRVRGNERKPFKRVIIDFIQTSKPQNLKTSKPQNLTLEDAPNHRSKAYATLTHDFYL